MEEKCPLCNGMGRLIKLSYLEGLIHNDIKRLNSENGIKDFLIELDENYKEKVNGDLVSFLRNIDGLDKEIYLNYVNGIEGYKIEPLIFKNQKTNLEKYLIKLD